jgi:hypothetical protein
MSRSYKNIHQIEIRECLFIPEDNPSITEENTLLFEPVQGKGLST